VQPLIAVASAGREFLVGSHLGRGVQADRCHPWAYQLHLSDGALLRPADDKCNFWPAASVVDVVERS
jgi:hypothetical protein